MDSIFFSVSGDENPNAQIPLIVLMFMLPAMLALTPAPGPTAGYQDLVNQGDARFLQRSDLPQAFRAAELYRRAAGLDPDRAEAWWKLARALVVTGSASPDPAGTAKNLKTGVDSAQMAVKLAPNEAAPHYWLALNYALLRTGQGHHEKPVPHRSHQKGAERGHPDRSGL